MFSWITDKICEKIKEEREGKLKVKVVKLTSVSIDEISRLYTMVGSMFVLIVFLYRQLQKSNQKLKQLSHEVHQCKICFEPFNGSNHRPAKINCNHVYFCEPCLTTIAGKFNQTGRCPICNDRFNKNDISPLYMSFV